MGRRSGPVQRIPAVWLVIGGIVSVQFGAAIAKDLFAIVPPTAMVWLRLVTSAVVFLVVARPRVRGAPDGTGWSPSVSGSAW
jgi:inner membrane transporter RhtA